MNADELIYQQTPNGRRIDWGASWEKHNEGRSVSLTSATEDKRDMRDPEAVGREILALKNGGATPPPGPARWGSD